MPNFLKALKDEIRRLAKKEAKALLGPLTKRDTQLLKVLSSLERKITAIEEKLAGAQPKAPAARARVVAPARAVKADKTAYTAGSIAAMRKKLGLSQADFGKLIGVSTQSVFQWEHKKGVLPLRSRARAALAAVKGIGADQAREMLTDMGHVKKKRGRKPGRKAAVAPKRKPGRPPRKRKPGRPPKKAAAKRGPGRPPMKRGPGRPPKKAAAKRGPGRPPMKRGPGRPPKKRGPGRPPKKK